MRLDDEIRSLEVALVLLGGTRSTDAVRLVRARLVRLLQRAGRTDDVRRHRRDERAWRKRQRRRTAS